MTDHNDTDYRTPSTVLDYLARRVGVTPEELEQ